MITGLGMERTEKGKELRKDHESGKSKHGFNEHRKPTPRKDGLTNTIDTNQTSQLIIQRGRGFNKGGEKDICPTISSNAFEQNNHVGGAQIRRLTEVEVERLQGFPDNWTQYGLYLKRSVQKYIFSNQKKWRTATAIEGLFKYAINNTTLDLQEIAKTHRYKQMGNAVTTNWPRMIAERLFNE
jgi:site-specific DNA-cytosine methylase